VGGMTWSTIDGILGVPNLGNNFQNNTLFGASNSTGGQGARGEMALVKPLSFGGVATLSFLTDYRNINNSLINPVPAFGVLNPQYTARFSLGLEMPLWRDAGVGINQLLSTFPSISGLSFL